MTKKITLEEVIDETVLAIFEKKSLAEALVLKGGTGLRLLQNVDKRTSTDVDFSHGEQIEEAAAFFQELKSAVEKRFSSQDLLVFDFVSERKPKQSGPNDPPGWGGWLVKFKLGLKAQEGLGIEARRRNAIVPKGSNTSVMEVEISEHEYVANAQTKSIRGVKVRGYSLAMFVGEKLRAICQQSSQYRQKKEKKNRAKDFFDIYQLSQQMTDKDRDELRSILKSIFEAKSVAYELLNEFWNNDFIELQKKGFPSVEAQAKSKTEPFEIYLENIRFLLLQDLKFVRSK